MKKWFGALRAIREVLGVVDYTTIAATKRTRTGRSHMRLQSVILYHGRLGWFTQGRHMRPPGGLTGIPPRARTAKQGWTSNASISFPELRLHLKFHHECDRGHLLPRSTHHAHGWVYLILARTSCNPFVEWALIATEIALNPYVCMPGGCDGFRVLEYLSFSSDKLLTITIEFLLAICVLVAMWIDESCNNEYWACGVGPCDSGRASPDCGGM